MVPDMTTTYTATTVHLDGVRVTHHASFEDAMASALTRSPEYDGTTLPNIPDELIDNETYESGVFWFNNRFAVIDGAR